MREENSSLQTQFAEMGSKRKHKEIEKSVSSEKKIPKLTNIKSRFIIKGSSYKSTQEEPNRQSLQRPSTSEQVLHEKANRSDVNEASSMAVISSEHADISNKMTQTIPERNKKLEANCTANTCEPNSCVSSKKFRRRSGRRRYARRQLKKEMIKQATESMQEEVLPNGTDQLASSNLSVPEQETTEIAEKETVSSSNKILAMESQEIFEISSSQVTREENSSLQTKWAETDLKRKHKEIEKSESSEKKIPKLTNIKSRLVMKLSSYKSTQEEPKQQSLQRASTSGQVLHEKVNHSNVHEASPMAVIATENADISNKMSQTIPERNKKLEANCTANTCEPNCSVPTKKFPSRSARRKYLKRQLKKEMTKRAAEGTVEDTTISEIRHSVFSRLQPPTACVDRPQQVSSASRIICKSHHPAPLPLGNSSSSCHKLVTPSDCGGQILEKNLPSENSWNSISADDAIELLRDPTGNVAVRGITTKSMLYYAPLISTSDNPLPISTIRSDPIQLPHQISILLNQDNFLLWKSQVIPILRSHGLISFIDNSKSSPNPTVAGTNGENVPNPEIEAWQQQDQLILAWIFNSVSPQILAQVINCETSLKLWQRLHQMHTSQSLAKVLELRLQLQTFKKGGATCIQYLQYMQSLAARLKSIGSDISEQDLVIYILQGLGSEYETFITAVSMRLEPLTMAELQSLLLSHEARFQAHSLSRTTENLANQSSYSNPQHLSLFNGLKKQANLNQNQPMAFTSDSTALYVGVQPGYSSQIGAQNYNTQTTTPVPFTENQYSSNLNRGRENSRSRGCGCNLTPDADEPQCQCCLKWGHTPEECYLVVPLESSSTAVNNDRGTALGSTCTRFRQNTDGATGDRSNASRGNSRWRGWTGRRESFRGHGN